MRLKSAGGMMRLIQVDPSIRLALLIIVGSVPTALIGLLFKKSPTNYSDRRPSSAAC
ncbi:hypothetical protein [Desulfosarcina cetonica]|uniref:hypothetical protein n=1 Tax=Desulfosarcina cetonica TaxID=90730 RepID=UPI00155DB606|nr:hypothetical protein [Desulfosarcina cetonica]